MTTDALEQLSDEDLSEVYAVELGGWMPLVPNENCCRSGQLRPEIGIPYYILDASAAFAWIEHMQLAFTVSYSPSAPLAAAYWFVFTDSKTDAAGYSIIRAACIAGIREKRRLNQST